MKRKILPILLLSIITITFVACRNNVNVNNEDNKIEVLNNEDSEKDKSINDSNKNQNVNSDESKVESDKNSNDVEEKKITLLNEIDSRAKDGMVIGCDFKAKDGVIDDVIKEWGQEESSNYIEEAKGLYFTFKDKDIVFGCNKGSQIFEVRTFNKNLSILNLKDIENYFGIPPYDIVTTSNERIIGYVVSDNFKILFVFNNGKESNETLDHYSVLYPKGTLNMMADDIGREW